MCGGKEKEEGHRVVRGRSVGTTAYWVQGKGSEWRSASRRRQLQTRTIHKGDMPNPPSLKVLCSLPSTLLGGGGG